MAIAGPIAAVVTFVVMQLAFGAAAGGAGGWTLPLQIIGFVAFILWLASIVACVAGVICVIVWAVRHS